MQKIRVILKKGYGERFSTHEPDGHSFHIELFPNVVNGGYAWNISNSGDKKKWGKERDFYTAHSESKRKYNSREECLPVIEQKVLEIYGEEIQITLEMAQEQEPYL